jgi:hypothetical protein
MPARLVAHTYNPRLRQEDLKFKASLGYIGRTCLKSQRKEEKMPSIKGQLSPITFSNFQLKTIRRGSE